MLIFYYFVKHCELNKPNIIEQNYSSFTHLKKKKGVNEIVQVEQTKNTIGSRHLLFLYIDNIIYKKKVGVHDKKKNSSHQIGQMP